MCYWLFKMYGEMLDLGFWWPASAAIASQKPRSTMISPYKVGNSLIAYLHIVITAFMYFKHLQQS